MHWKEKNFDIGHILELDVHIQVQPEPDKMDGQRLPNQVGLAQAEYRLSIHDYGLKKLSVNDFNK